MARNALGRGLGALIREQEVTPQAIPPNSPTGAATAATPAPIAAGGPLHSFLERGAIRCAGRGQGLA